MFEYGGTHLHDETCPFPSPYCPGQEAPTGETHKETNLCLPLHVQRIDVQYDPENTQKGVIYVQTCLF